MLLILSIAVLGYGSLMNNLQSKNYHKQERYGPSLHVHLDNDPNFSSLKKVGATGKKVFRIDPGLKLPVALKGKAGAITTNRRFTRVIDPSDGIPYKPIAYAISDFNSLNDSGKRRTNHGTPDPKRIDPENLLNQTDALDKT